MSELAFLEINLKNVTENVSALKKCISDKVQFMAVVKANGYGHGLTEATKAAIAGGVNWLGVVNIGEAATLRKNDIKAPILVLGFVGPDDLMFASENGITCAVYSKEYAEQIAKIDFAGELRVHLKIETGLNRLGMEAGEVRSVVKILQANPKIIIDGIYSHLAAAEEGFEDFTNNQMAVLKEMIEDLKKDGIDFKYCHIGASAASLVFPDEAFNLARFGVAIYGLWPSKETKDAVGDKITLRPAMSYKTKIIQIKNIKAGEKIGYGCTYEVKEPMTMAVIPIGYYDGIDRRFSSSELGGEVLISAKRCPFAGRIAMNMAMVDVTAISGSIKTGDEVVLIGNQGSEEITVDEWAQKLGTINYEIVSRMPAHLKRIFKR